MLLWKRAAPSYQLGVYYREGELESCSQKFKNVLSCLQLQTQYADRVVRAIIQHYFLSLSHSRGVTSGMRQTVCSDTVFGD